MQPVLSNRVVLMAVILAGGLTLASTLVARSTFLAPHAGPAAVEPSLVGGDSGTVDLPGIAYVEGGYERTVLSVALPGDISTVRAAIP